jgi:hypothetical protein
MPKDACYKKVKAQYDVFPSARASQAITTIARRHAVASELGTSATRLPTN